MGPVGNQVKAVSVAYGDSRRDYGELVSKARVPRQVGVIDALPDDDECHHCGLAGARGHLGGQPVDTVVVPLVFLGQRPVVVAILVCHLKHVYQSLDGFFLCKE